LKIKDVKLFEEHRENTHKINLYAVNSNFKEEIQIIVLEGSNP